MGVWRDIIKHGWGHRGGGYGITGLWVGIGVGVSLSRGRGGRREENILEDRGWDKGIEEGLSGGGGGGG